MLTNTQSDFLYLADSLNKKFPSFALALKEKLKLLDINFSELQNTKDIWCRDFMPIQIARDRFVEFQYSPDYLKSQKYKSDITDVDAVCQRLKIKIVKSSIVLDGGNVVCSKRKVILTDKVFTDNKEKSKEEILQELRNLFEVDTIIIIPKQPYDVFGHADGMIRFIDDDTVLVNDFSQESAGFRTQLNKALDKHKLLQIQFTYAPSSEVNADNIPSASGTYINYLHIGEKILMPVFGLPTDEIALRQLSEIYPTYSIVTINCEEIAKEGGVLNCIGWNVQFWKLILEDFGEFYLVKN